MRGLVIVALVSAFLLPLGASALAADKADKLDKAFKRLDKNGDQKLSLEEFVGKRTGEKAEKAKKQFARLDKNKDESLSLEEFKTRKKKKD